MTTNTQGAPLGPNGFVLCRTCGKETQDVSRESPPEYAYHLKHPGKTKEEEELW